MAKLIMTIDQMKDENNWLAMRTAGIGGSDAAVALGLSAWKSPFQLWLEKTGAVEPEDLKDNEYVYWGKVLEQAVADRFCDVTGKKVRRCGLLQSEEHSFMLASVDRMVVGENAGLECKTTSEYAKGKWADNEIPDAYYVQCQHYMAVTGCEKWYIAVLIGGNKFIWKEIPRSEDDIAALIDAEKDFWRMVTEREMPDADGTEQCRKALQNHFRGGQVESVILGNDAAEIIAAIDELKKSIDDLTALKKEKENRICKMLGDHEVGLVGERKITWKPQNGRITFDSKSLKSDHPDIYKKYIKQGKPIRVLRIG